MLYAFVDESARDKSHYFLGAVVVTESEYENLVQGLNELMVRFESIFPIISASDELHGSAIMRREDMPWRKVPKRLSFHLFHEALRVIVASNASIIIETQTVSSLDLTPSSEMKSSLREIALRKLLLTLDTFSADLGEEIKVIADNHHTADISLNNFLNYRIFGVDGSGSSTLRNIYPELGFISSGSDRALQASDLVTYLCNRVITVREHDERAHHAKMRLWEIVKPAIVQSSELFESVPESTMPPSDRGQRQGGK